MESRESRLRPLSQMTALRTALSNPGLLAGAVILMTTYHDERGQRGDKNQKNPFKTTMEMLL
jgi:hypothetical protein